MGNSERVKSHRSRGRRMKEIKFRAWDKEQKIMYLPEYSEIRYMAVESLNADNSLLEIMQYTGLKDKIGKEIYEGDIVSCWGGEYCLGFWEFSKIILVDAINNPFTILDLTESENTKVIGNIYENPELLEVEE